MKNNYSKIIRFNNTYYTLPKQETVCSFKKGGAIFTRNLENQFGDFPKNVQQKILEQQPQWIQLGSSIDAPSEINPYGIYDVSLNSSGTVLATVTPYAYAGTQHTLIGQTMVYAWNGSSWAQRGSTIYGESNGDFPTAVNLNSSGNVLAIGASNNDGNGSNSGHVRVYSWNGSSWVKIGADIDGEASGDFSGRSIDLNASGDTLAIGAINNDGNGSNSGHVRVYSWNGSSWVQKGADLDGATINQQWIGKSVKLDATGNILAACGPVYVSIYEWNGSSWTLLWTKREIEIYNRSNIMSIELAKDGKTLAVGIYRQNDTAIVKTYRRSGSSWIQLGPEIEGEYPEVTFGGTSPSDAHGESVSLNYSGNVLAVGAPGHYVTTTTINGSEVLGYQVGRVKVYRWNGTSWVRKGISFDGKNNFDAFGDAVSLNESGDRLAIAASRFSTPPFPSLPGRPITIGYTNIYSWE